MIIIIIRRINRQYLLKQKRLEEENIREKLNDSFNDSRSLPFSYQ